MTDLALMRLCAARSIAAQSQALHAIRAIGVDSPVIAQRVASVAETALRDTSAEWTDDERTLLVDACARRVSGPVADDPARARLSVLVRDFGAAGGSQAAFAGLLGVDERTLTRWLTAEMPIPGARARMLARIVRVDVTRDRVTLVLER